MFSMHARAVDVIKTGAACLMAEMRAFIAVPGMPGIRIPEGAVAAPITVHKGPIGAIIITVIIIRPGRGDIDARPSRAHASRKGNSRGQRRQSDFFQHKLVSCMPIPLRYGNARNAFRMLDQNLLESDWLWK